MSRLDDELKMAFRREPAPPGFTDKVMERIAARRLEHDSREHVNWWRSLPAWFSATRLLRAAAVAMLLVAIVLVAYRMLAVSPVQQVARDTEGEGAQPPVRQSSGPTRSPEAATARETAEPGLQPTTKSNSVRRASQVSVRVPRRRPEVTPPDQAEAAREQVMLALQIASSTLAGAQRSVQEDEDYSKSK
jgi:hypothetical protein